MTEERDLAHEADMRELMRDQLRGDIDIDEANRASAFASREAYWDEADALYWGDND